MSTILLVEDTPALAKEVTDLLTMENLEVIVAEDGLKAMSILEDVRPDLIISDLLMPNMDGLELLSALKQRKELRGIPTIIMTARGGEDIQSKALALGARCVLLKPCRAVKLIETINHILHADA